MTDDEYERLNDLIAPLFEMFLDFERAFATFAIDALNISDEDAVASALMLLKEVAFSSDAEPTNAHAFAYLLRHIKTERMLRQISHQFAAVNAAHGQADPCGYSLPELAEAYAKLPKGKA